MSTEDRIFSEMCRFKKEQLDYEFNCFIRNKSLLIEYVNYFKQMMLKYMQPLQLLIKVHFFMQTEAEQTLIM